MKLLLYASTDNTGLRLKKCIDQLSVHQSIETFDTIDSLSSRLSQPVSDLALTVILVASSEELEKIIGFGYILQNIKTIIILPNRNPETISAAHKLYPRLIGYADEDFKDIAAVADRILKQLNMQN